MEKTYNIISYGESLLHWQKIEKPVHPNFISFGVNHVGMFTDVDYLLLVDHSAHFTPEKIEAIKNTMPYNYFIVDLSWMKLLKKCVPVTLGKDRSNLKNLDNDFMFSQVPYSYNSPFIAACLAYRMGARIINLYGVDFNTDSSCNDEFAPKNIRDWNNLYLTLTAKGIKLYTTPESKLSNFIPINPILNLTTVNHE